MTDKPKEDKGKIKVDSSQDLHLCDSDLEASTQDCGSRIFWRYEVHLDHFWVNLQIGSFKEENILTSLDPPTLGLSRDFVCRSY